VRFLWLEHASRHAVVKRQDFKDPRYLARRAKKVKRILAYEGAEGFAFLIAKADRGSAQDLIDYVRTEKLSQTEREELAWYLEKKLIPKKAIRPPDHKPHTMALRRAALRVEEMRDAFKKKQGRGNVPTDRTMAFTKKAISSEALLTLAGRP
jgi:hypothetical protein